MENKTLKLIGKKDGSTLKSTFAAFLHLQVQMFTEGTWEKNNLM